MAELPRPLPGFYYDPALKRYFPGSSKPKAPPSQQSTNVDHVQSSRPQRSESRSAPPARLFRSLEGLLDRSEIERITHSYQARALSSLHLKHKGRLNLHPLSYAGEATCLAVTAAIHVAGASDGDLYTRRLGDASPTSQGPEQLGPWVLERSLHTSITNVTIMDDRYFAASLGPVPRIAVTSLERSAECHIVNLPKAVQDVRIASFTPSGFALGCSGRAFFCARVEDMSRGMTHLPTRSDVVALYQDEHELFIGTRGGAVRLWDVRLPPSSSNQVLFASTSVTHLRVIHETSLLVCLINGAVDLFDLRFLRSAPSTAPRQPPILSLHGHQNSYTPDLACAVSNERDVLFLAGQDHRIRAWSLATADHLDPPPATTDNPLSTIFLRPIKAMAFSEEGGGVDLHAIDGYNSYAWGVKATKS